MRYASPQRRIDDDGDVLDVRGAMKLLGLGRNAVYDACARNELPHRRIGKLLRFSRGALLRWLEGDRSGHDLPTRVRFAACGRSTVQEH
jgi:excisionase family DNA binding protein